MSTRHLIEVCIARADVDALVRRYLALVLDGVRPDETQARLVSAALSRASGVAAIRG